MESRKLFGTDGIRGKANRYPMTPEMALKLGKAIALHFERKGIPPKAVIGKDTRISGYMLETALTSGLVSMGAEVLLVGPMPTPAVSFLVKELAAVSGIVISASHNPAEDNGIKLFDSRGLKLSDEDEHSIEKIIFSEQLNNGFHDGRHVGKAFRVEDARQRYTEFVKSTVENVSLKGIRVVVDCANGAAYKIAPEVLSSLGAEVIAINNKPDGFNINKGCGAIHIEAVSRKVQEESADIGIALDGDADRVIIVDAKGNEVNGDRIMACLALDLKEKGRLAQDTLVATVMSNSGLEAYMKTRGIKVVRTKVGDKYVIEEMKANNYNFGGEQSGHIIYGDHSTTGDGTITAIQFLRLMKEKNMGVNGLANGFELYPQVLINVPVMEKKPFDEVHVIADEIKAAEKKLAGKGRALVRYSGTENIARVMVEGQNISEVEKIARSVADAITKELGLNSVSWHIN